MRDIAGGQSELVQNAPKRDPLTAEVVVVTVDGLLEFGNANRLAKLERYERHAYSRRKRALGALIP